MNEELRNNVGKHPLILAIISAFCILHSAFASVYNGVYADTNNAILPGYTFNAANLTGNVSSNQLPTNLLYTVTLSAATNTLMTNVTAQIAAATNSVATNTAALLTAATNAVATNLIARLSAATNTVATNVTAQILTATNTIATNTAALLTAATNSVTTNTAAQISLATNSVTTNLTAILAGKTNPVFSGTVTIGGVTRTSWPTGAGVTTNASDLTTGTLDAGRLPAAAVTNNGAATLATLTLDSVTRSTWPAAIDPTTNAAALTTGTLDDARLSAHVVTNTAGVGLTVENDGLRIVGANGNPMALHHLNPNWLVSWDVNTTAMPDYNATYFGCYFVIDCRPAFQGLGIYNQAGSIALHRFSITDGAYASSSGVSWTAAGDVTATSFSGGGTGLTGVNAATTAAVTGYHEETVTVTADSGATWTNRTVLIKDY